MNSKYQRRESTFLKSVLIFGGSLVGLLAVGIFVAGLLKNEAPEFRADTPVTTEDASFAEVTPETPVYATEPVTSQPEPVTMEDLTPISREVTYAEAESAFSNRQYVKALDLFTLYTEQHPGNAWGHYMFGLSAWKAGEPSDAVLGFETAIKLDPKHLKSHTNLVRVLLDESRPGEARRYAETAVNLDPARGESHRMLARVYHNLGDIEPAVESYRRAIQFDSTDAWAMNNLGFLFIETERFEEALAPLALASSIQPDRVLFHNNLGIALERTGRYQEAGDAFRRALVVDDTDLRVLANLERVDGRVTEPGLELDLGELASGFRNEMTQPVEVAESN